MQLKALNDQFIWGVRRRLKERFPRITGFPWERCGETIIRRISPIATGVWRALLYGSSRP